MVLFLDCPKDALTKRLLERGKTSGRADDNIESVLKRFDTFETESLPVVEELDKLGMVGVQLIYRVCTFIEAGLQVKKERRPKYIPWLTVNRTQNLQEEKTNKRRK